MSIAYEEVKDFIDYVVCDDNGKWSKTLSPNAPDKAISAYNNFLKKEMEKKQKLIK